jgi:hypothetical protein
MSDEITSRYVPRNAAPLDEAKARWPHEQYRTERPSVGRRTRQAFVFGADWNLERLEWLLDARAEYSHPDVQAEVEVGRHLLSILRGENDGKGWLPSWRWDDWEKTPQ